MEHRLYSHLTLGECEKNCAEIDLDALCENYRLLCRVLPADGSCQPIAVVKADAYGHGAPACVSALLAAGCRFFAVATLGEALAVRCVTDAACVEAEILILGYTDPAHAEQLAAHRLLQALLSDAYARRLAEAARAAGATVRVHVALDTGMGRIGLPALEACDAQRAADTIATLVADPALSVEGMFSHFSTADEPQSDPAREQTALQSARFFAVKQALEARGIFLKTLHLCNSAGMLWRPGDHLDAVRMGLSLYGVSPYPGAVEGLRPVMRLVSTVVHLAELPAGASLGYGADFRADSPRVIATLPIGYADGFLRAYRHARVTLHTQKGDVRVPIVGRICMDQCMLDVTGTAAAVGDRVTLFGAKPGELERLALAAGTIPYEVLTSVSARVVRVPFSKNRKDC